MFEVWLQVVGDINLVVFHCIKNLIISLDLYGLGIFSGECNSKEFGKLVSTEGGKKRKAEMPHDEVVALWILKYEFGYSASSLFIWIGSFTINLLKVFIFMFYFSGFIN